MTRGWTCREFGVLCSDSNAPLVELYFWIQAFDTD